jgi:hypothetical protein
MIIAGWILALLGLAQVVFAGAIGASQLTEGDRLIGQAPSVVANLDLVGQRAMTHMSGVAASLAGAIFIAAGLHEAAAKGRPRQGLDRHGRAGGGADRLGGLLDALHLRNADQRPVDEIRARETQNLSTEALWQQAEERLKRETEAEAAARLAGAS